MATSLYPKGPPDRESKSLVLIGFLAPHSEKAIFFPINYTNTTPTASLDTKYQEARKQENPRNHLKEACWLNNNPTSASGIAERVMAQSAG